MELSIILINSLCALTSSKVSSLSTLSPISSHKPCRDQKLTLPVLIDLNEYSVQHPCMTDDDAASKPLSRIQTQCLTQVSQLKGLLGLHCYLSHHNYFAFKKNCNKSFLCALSSDSFLRMFRLLRQIICYRFRNYV